MQELNKRNTETAAAAISDLYEKVYALSDLVVLQNTSFAALQERMNNLEQQLIIQKVKLTGLGPSVRE